ncbi:MAG TPA: ABC transporter permease, partial [Propionicimonas sp.]|nr:ABC transporter permease [Propionicimonas sp.]
WSWLSPIGWYQAMHAYSGERWWPLVLLAGFTALVGVAVHAVFDRRDIGSGLWAARPGPARASAGLQSGLGLAWRLQRASLLGWTIGMFLLGLTFGGFGDDVESMLGDSEVSRAMFGAGGDVLLDSFYAASSAMLAVIAAGYTVSSALRPRGEEDQGRVETLLATALPRTRWLLGHVSVTLAGTVLAVAAAGVGLGVGFGLVSGDWDRFGRLTAACLVQIPGVLVLGAVARLLHGWLPRAASLAWLGVIFCAVVMFFGELLDFPQWMVDISPLTHLGSYPASSVDWTGFALLLAGAALASAAGLWGVTRRDVA